MEVRFFLFLLIFALVYIGRSFSFIQCKFCVFFFHFYFILLRVVYNGKCINFNDLSICCFSLFNLKLRVRYMLVYPIQAAELKLNLKVNLKLV
jgi:hypothetical protein